MASTRRVALGSILAVALVSVLVWCFVLRRPAPESPAEAIDEPASAPAASAGRVAASASAPATPARLDLPASAAPPSSADLPAQLAQTFGPAAVALMQTDDFARRFVATVDNLGRDRAATSLWPVVPTPGRFTVETGADGAVIGAANAARYSPLVDAITAVDAARVVDLYLRLYPALQTAYEEIGFPQRYFNDRLLELIDGLVAAPEPTGPVRVELPEIKGPVASERPWVRYQFAEPGLEALPSGQKIMLRMGADNARRLKAWLREVRSAIAARQVPR